MRSGADGDRLGRRAAVATAAALVLATAIAAGQSTTRPEGGAPAPSRQDVDAALQRLRDDPDFAPEREVQTLRWTQPSEAQRSEAPGWFTWLLGFGQWMNQSARYLIWVSAGLAAAWLAASLVRALTGRTTAPGEAPFTAPTHVGDLDIRPDTLPADIGAAARALWDGGQHRAALALLYRGLLSRLAHEHRLPILDSTTEGDCLALAAAALPQPTHAYAERLVRLWQRTVYGRQPAATAFVHRVCDEFASMLDRRAEHRQSSGGAG